MLAQEEGGRKNIVSSLHIFPAYSRLRHVVHCGRNGRSSRSPSLARARGAERSIRVHPPMPMLVATTRQWCYRVIFLADL